MGPCCGATKQELSKDLFIYIGNVDSTGQSVPAKSAKGDKMV